MADTSSVDNSPTETSAISPPEHSLQDEVKTHVAADSVKSDPVVLNGSRWQRFKQWTLVDDPRDEIELQPHMKERLTRKSEQWAFFVFCFGYLAWANTCGSLFEPLLVQNVARSASVLKEDHSIPCPPNNPEDIVCVIPFGFVYVEPTSYTLLINVVSVWCTIVVTLGASAVADHGRRSKRMLLFFIAALMTVTGMMFLGAVDQSIWWITGTLMVVGNVLNGVALNLFDAHIPHLARHHPDVVRAMIDHGETSAEYRLVKTKTSTHFSAGASTCGYIGGFFMTLFGAFILIFYDASALALGYCLVMCSGYVLITTIVYSMWSHQRTNPPLPPGASIWTYGYVRIAKTVRQARSLKTMFAYLACWFLLGDGLAASSSMAILIAQDTLNLSNQSLIIAALIQYVAAGSSMFFWIWLQNSKGVKPMRVVITNASLFGLVPCYCLLGLIDSSPIGLKHEWELYMLAVFFGFFIGAIYSANRVVFSSMIPQGQETELFALFEMASVTSSWIAPLVCTFIIELHGPRYTWFFLASQFFIPAVGMCFIDVDKGVQEGRDFYLNEQAQLKKILDSLNAEKDTDVKTDLV